MAFEKNVSMFQHRLMKLKILGQKPEFWIVEQTESKGKNSEKKITSWEAPCIFKFY